MHFIYFLFFFNLLKFIFLIYPKFNLVKNKIKFSERIVKFTLKALQLKVKIYYFYFYIKDNQIFFYCQNVLSI